MAEPLKEIFNKAAVDWLAARLAAASPAFPAAAFRRNILVDLPALELKARIERIAVEMRQMLPADFPRAVKIVEMALGKPPPAGDGSDFGDFRVLACHRFVSLAGQDHADLALGYFERTTRHFSAEFDVRPFIARDLAQTLARMRRWADDADWRVRRLASEGSRPRLPWGLRLQALVADPAPLFPILEALRDDPVEAVRRSVANSLNDIGKDHPDRLVRYLTDWTKVGPGDRAGGSTAKDDGPTPLVRHALRHLVKQGHSGALGLMGVGPAGHVTAGQLHLARKKVPVGGSLDFALDLANDGSTPERLIVDYAIHHLGARGALHPKIFKWSAFELGPGETRRLQRRHSLKPVTTRRFYPGTHLVDVRVNGRIVAQTPFILAEAGAGGARTEEIPGTRSFSGRYR